MTENMCASCIHAHFQECRRFPPTDTRPESERRFPLILPHDWCGEYERRPPTWTTEIPTAPGRYWTEFENGDVAELSECIVRIDKDGRSWFERSDIDFSEKDLEVMVRKHGLRLWPEPIIAPKVKP